MKSGNSIKIDQIRRFQTKIYEKPVISKRKIYIINNADTMTKEAQNCLLKTLEEPPEFVLIILIVQNENSILNTVKSRCIKLLFNNLTEEDIQNYFSVHNLELSTGALKSCGGSIEKAISISNGNLDFQSIECFIDNIRTENIVNIFNNTKVFHESKEDINLLLEYLIIYLNDKLKYTKDIKYASCITYVETTKDRVKSNANYDMCMDSLLLKIWEEFNEKYSWC